MRNALKVDFSEPGFTIFRGKPACPEIADQ